MCAVSARPVPLAVPPMRAWFVTLARVIAMAAPMPAEPLVVALPSALDAASAASRACRVSMPPLVTLTRTGIDAVDDAFASVIAIAAATLIGLPPVEALGVLVPPVPEPPPEAAAPFALLRSPAT